LAAPSRKSNGKVTQDLGSFYAEWRVRCGVVPLLREDLDSPPEHLLQAVWQHQRLLRDQLKTLDGEPVRILHPGFRSLEGGPDFRGAVVQVGGGPPRTGDVEVDLRSSGWRAHRHDRNPAFQNVILHVIWESEPPAAGTPPVLVLRHALDAPLGELSLWLGSEAAQELPQELRGQCCAPLRGLGSTQLLDLLCQAARVRLQSKGAQLQARARQVGWEQSLWEGLFRGLGYKNNVWPMQRVAELRPRWQAGAFADSERGHPCPPACLYSEQVDEHVSTSSAAPRRAGAIADSAQVLAVQARLFGISGLLPAELTRSRAGTDGYLRRVWDEWWRERGEFSDCILPRALWHLHGLRPANQPQRRLALASYWSVTPDLPSKLERWCAQTMRDAALAGSLLETLEVEPDDFWSWHFTFRSARLRQPQPLLGVTRVTDLAVNVVLPWLWIRAVEGKRETVLRAIEHRYFAWPAAEDNALLRLARQRLLGGAPRRALPGAAAQQGLMQMVRDFCDHSNAICQDCKLPHLVRDWSAQHQVRNDLT
jgi:hypothetical protein